MKKHTYKGAGVNIEEADRLITQYRRLAQTAHKGILSGIGGFGAMTKIPDGYFNPVLVSSTDGVGTKLKIAFQLDVHNTIGIDLVAMSANDVLVQGAKPMFFLDYLAVGKLKPSVVTDIVSGIAEGCHLADCPLIGGETAEMPGMYKDGEYDLAGFCVGIVEQSRVVNGHSILPGDAVIGIGSSGIHSNGYSLVRQIIKSTNTDLSSPFSGGLTFGEELLRPTKIYVNSILQIMDNVRIGGMAHITGGGIVGNLPRILPTPVRAIIDRSSWPTLPIFEWIQREGNVDDKEMLNVFNCGIGMILVVALDDAPKTLELLQGFGETAYHIGTIERRDETQPQTEVV